MRRRLAPKARMAPARINRVGKERLVVGPHVERDGQREGRVDPGSRGVDGELADRDPHPACTLVAQPEDPLVVGHDDQPDLLLGRVAKELRDAARVVRGDPHAARTAKDVAVLLAGASDGGRVDDRQELLQVLR